MVLILYPQFLAKLKSELQDYIMNRDTIIRELGNRLGIKDIQSDSEGRCYLLFDETLEVFIQKGREKNIVYFESNIDELPNQNKEEIYFKILKHSLLLFKNFDAVVAIDKDHDKIQLFSVVNVNNTNLNDLEIALEKFVNGVETLNKWYDSWKTQQSIKQSVSLNSSGLNIIRP